MYNTIKLHLDYFNDYYVLLKSPLKPYDIKRNVNIVYVGNDNQITDFINSYKQNKYFIHKYVFDNEEFIKFIELMKKLDYGTKPLYVVDFNKYYATIYNDSIKLKNFYMDNLNNIIVVEYFGENGTIFYSYSKIMKRIGDIYYLETPLVINTNVINNYNVYIGRYCKVQSFGQLTIEAPYYSDVYISLSINYVELQEGDI